MVDPPPFQKFNKGKPFQKKFSHNTATLVKTEITTNTNYIQYNQNQNDSMYEDDEDYPPNNICYECGKNLKWGSWCSDCGVSNKDDEEKETDVTIEQTDDNDIEERLELFVEEFRKWKNKTQIERESA